MAPEKDAYCDSHCITIKPNTNDYIRRRNCMCTYFLNRTKNIVGTDFDRNVLMDNEANKYRDNFNETMQ